MRYLRRPRASMLALMAAVWLTLLVFSTLARAENLAEEEDEPASEGVFVGNTDLPETDQVSSLLADPTTPVVAYFRETLDDPELELLLQSGTEADGVERYAFVQSHCGVPILGTFALAQVIAGRMHFARHRLVHSPTVQTHPRLTSTQAQAAALRVAAHQAAHAVPGPGPVSLAIQADDDPALVWVVPVSLEQPYGLEEVYIDAQDGSERGVRPTSMHGKAAPASAGGTMVAGAVSTMVEPMCQGDRPQVVPLPHVEWARGRVTAADGTFSADAAVDAATVRLEGPFFRIEDLGETGNLVPFSTMLHGAPAFNQVHIINFPLSQVDPFVYASRARAWVRGRVAETPDLHADGLMAWTMSQFVIRVNLPAGWQGASCNAFYDGRSLNFYAADPAAGCQNTGQAAKIVFHEYGHGIHDHLTWSRATFDPQVSEGAADYIAATITGSPNITGLKSCDELLPGRTTTRTCVNHYTYCRSRKCSSHPRDEPHNAAPVLCGAFWELREALGAEVADGLFLRFLTLASDMASAYEAAIAADEDDDDDPTNGTAHSCAINRAFLGDAHTPAHFPDARSRAMPCVAPTLPPS